MFTNRISVTVLSLLVALHLASVGMADVTIIEGRDIRPYGASPVGSNGRIFKLSISPAKQASPAFKYRFTIPPYETVPGNSVTHYLRSLGENSLDAPVDYMMKETNNKVFDWFQPSTKSEDIPLDKLQLASQMFERYIDNHLSRATRCRDTDWGIAVEDFRGRESIEFLLPSVQQTRTMARVLMIQNRLAVMEKRFDDSVELLRMAFQLGRNVNEMGFLVSSLVGVAEVGMANDGALLLLSSDEAPNLYWAFAELPTPIIDMRRALRLDSSLPLRAFPELMEIETANYNDQGWKTLLEKIIEDYSLMSRYVSSGININDALPNSQALSFAACFAGYSKAKQRLLNSGNFSKEQLDQMHVTQVILIDAARDIKRFSQAAEKSFYVPAAQADQLSDDWSRMMGKQSPTRLGAVITSAFAPVTTQVRWAGNRVQAQINLLMAIESIRNHLAVHSEFPESLQDLELPVRNNPITGKPFNYSLENGKAVLTFEPGHGGLQRYEISIND